MRLLLLLFSIALVGCASTYPHCRDTSVRDDLWRMDFEFYNSDFSQNVSRNISNGASAKTVGLVNLDDDVRAVLWWRWNEEYQTTMYLTFLGDSTLFQENIGTLMLEIENQSGEVRHAKMRIAGMGEDKGFRQIEFAIVLYPLDLNWLVDGRPSQPLIFRYNGYEVVVPNRGRNQNFHSQLRTLQRIRPWECGKPK